MFELGILVLVVVGACWLFGALIAGLFKLTFGLIGALFGGLFGLFFVGVAALLVVPIVLLALLPLMLPALCIAAGGTDRAVTQARRPQWVPRAVRAVAQPWSRLNRTGTTAHASIAWPSRIAG